MKLFEAIVDANHRALTGDESAGLHPSEFAESLPIVALTCIDPRLNPLLPEVLGIPEDKFIWLRNAGNILTGPLSSTMRSLALACAVKGGREIAVIGHTDCLIRKTSMLELTTRFHALGIDRSRLPENLNEYFGLFASERQNVLRGVEHIRFSPLIGQQIPVHGLLVDIESGRLEWLVNGYQALGAATARQVELPALPLQTTALSEPAPLSFGEMKFPETKIGEIPALANEFLEELRLVESHEPPAPPSPPRSPAKPIPVPPPIRVTPRPIRKH
jgi:carbonic anhydrase